MDKLDAIADLDVAAIKEAFASVGSQISLPKIEIWDELNSTNQTLVERASACADEQIAPIILVAHHQKAGVGRRDRTWTTPAGTALTMSTLVDVSEISVPRRGLLAGIAGLAVRRTLMPVCDRPIKIKWPNDIVVAHDDRPAVNYWGRWRKLAGILVQVVETPHRAFAIFGTGINVSQRSDQLPVPHATSLACSARDSDSRPVSRSHIAGTLGAHLIENLARFSAGSDEDFISNLVSGSATVGQEVTVSQNNGQTITGTAIGLGPVGELVIQDEQSNRHLITEGDVTSVRPYTGHDSDS